MSLFRSSPTHIYYSSHRTAVGYDEYITATAIAAGMLGVAWFCLLPTCKRKSTTILVNTSYAFAVFVFVVSILGLTAKSWQSGVVSTSSSYSAYSAQEVNGTIGLFVGLSSFNVTLKGEPEWQSVTAPGTTTTPVQNLAAGTTNTSQPQPIDTPATYSADIDSSDNLEQINYNEEISFGVRQGRPGYTHYSNNVNQVYRALQYRGVPYPIAWVIELFTLDGDGMRSGRIHRQAGYYAAFCLWFSLPLWCCTLLTLAAGLWGFRASNSSGVAGQYENSNSNSAIVLDSIFLLKSQLRPTALLCMATGIMLLGAPIIYYIIVSTNLNPVAIHFHQATLTLKWGWTFYLVACTGLIVFLGGTSGYIWCTWKHERRLKAGDVEYIWGKQDLTQRKMYDAYEQEQSQMYSHHHRYQSQYSQHRRGISASTRLSVANGNGHANGNGVDEYSKHHQQMQQQHPLGSAQTTPPLQFMTSPDSSFSSSNSAASAGDPFIASAGRIKSPKSSPLVIVTSPSLLQPLHSPPPQQQHQQQLFSSPQHQTTRLPGALSITPSSQYSPIIAHPLSARTTLTPHSNAGGGSASMLHQQHPPHSARSSQVQQQQQLYTPPLTSTRRTPTAGSSSRRIRMPPILDLPNDEVAADGTTVAASANEATTIALSTASTSNIAPSSGLPPPHHHSSTHASTYHPTLNTHTTTRLPPSSHTYMTMTPIPIEESSVLPHLQLDREHEQHEDAYLEGDDHSHVHFNIEHPPKSQSNTPPVTLHEEEEGEQENQVGAEGEEHDQQHPQLDDSPSFHEHD